MEHQIYQQVLQYLKEGQPPLHLEDVPTQRKRWHNFCKPFQVINDQLFRCTKWKQPVKVLRQGETEAIIYLYHNDPLAGHFGVQKTLKKIQQQYFWPQMYNEIKRYIDSCHTCQIQAKRSKNNELNPIEPTAPWERVGIDFVGPFNITDSGNRYIITAIDYFTRW